jgi:hypothetical protein
MCRLPGSLHPVQHMPWRVPIDVFLARKLRYLDSPLSRGLLRLTVRFMTMRDADYGEAQLTSY